MFVIRNSRQVRHHKQRESNSQKTNTFCHLLLFKIGRKSTNLYDSKLSEFLSKGERAIFIQLGKNMYFCKLKPTYDIL